MGAVKKRFLNELSCEVQEMIWRAYYTKHVMFDMRLVNMRKRTEDLDKVMDSISDI